MGRTKLWRENINVTLPEGGKAAMDAALREGEDRLDLVRSAISAELKKRGHDPLPDPPEPKGRRSERAKPKQS